MGATERVIDDFVDQTHGAAKAIGAICNTAFNKLLGFPVRAWA